MSITPKTPQQKSKFTPTPPLLSRPTVAQEKILRKFTSDQREGRTVCTEPLYIPKESERKNRDSKILKLLSKDNKNIEQTTKVSSSDFDFVEVLQQEPKQSQQPRTEKTDYAANTDFVNKVLHIEGILRGLSDDQKQVIDLANSGVSFFFSGAAGTGKSYVMKKMISILRQTHELGVYVTASTGIAACNIGGTTLHSFAGIGLGDLSGDQLLTKVIKNSQAFDRWKKAEVILIDEISMISGELLEKLDYVAKNIKRNQQPFGGIQMIFSGDFFQLPPVSKNQNIKFVFEVAAWKNAVKECVILHTQHRQNDLEFIDILNNIRYGYFTKKAQEVLQTCQKKNLGSEKRTCLYSHRADADTMNRRELDKLKEETTTFECLDNGIETSKKSLKDCQAPDKLVLKKGAVVMLLKNIAADLGLVNGAVGTVIGFEPMKEIKLKELKENEKSQFCDIRVTERSFYAHNKVFPLVQFEKTKYLVIPDVWEIEIGGIVMACRVQLPLAYAWALSIHKSQGLTLPRAEVNLEKVFESGQAYVALSRLQSLDGLKIVGNLPGQSAWRVNPKVLQFYKEHDKCFKEVDPSELVYKPSQSQLSQTTQSSQPKRTASGKTIIVTKSGQRIIIG
ncbi:hypothetical protein EIN_034430 [Entamoeba invadens IP1]|uniref:ATP-dependent DNA helicase n=1 Tax=Entamoeba invadens IP1 TaxID=370355 RepID=A0A0A1TYB5_ENTIV|nr:hypothetical protein EIN_034430 [Entamoeba invadens IP1]ELP86512.1 hypothetical protein EIN_034430 [Entamoeba invadens IP1]|eukprot:XP_004185858.1 hypothetical protein EIN_034430 [Entamoeba invadens IP1]